MDLRAGATATDQAASDPHPGSEVAGPTAATFGSSDLSRAGGLLARGPRGLVPADPRTLLALQRTIGNAGVGRLLSRTRSGARIARTPTGTVPEAARQAAGPLLDSMGVDQAGFYRGELVVGEIKNPGKPTTIVFVQLQPGRLRAGIFSISVKGDPEGALKAFASFRGGARDLAKALRLPKMELLGAAVMNPDIGPMLDRLGFTIDFEPLPETLGALPGEKIEVYKKVFDVKLPPASSATPEPATAAAGPSQQELPLKAPAVVRPAIAPAIPDDIPAPSRAPRVPVSTPPAQLELPLTRPPATRGGTAGGGWGPALADFGVFLIGNAVMSWMYGRIAANEQAMFDATIPEIQARTTALADQARARQVESAGQTLWVNVLIVPTYWRVEDTKPGEGGDHTSLTEVRVDTVALGNEYRSQHTQGEPKLVRTNGAWVNIWERHDALELSFPFPYDPSVMTRDQIVRRLIENERDARRWSVLPGTVLDTLSEERAALLEARDELSPPAGVEFAP